ncbi:MAG: glycosyltransferase family 4 protein [Chloroflexi bacterium]|nr:glycosyltransferase family 4 protein [Chloroflexota bacterium]
MRILFVTPATPLAENYSGAASRYRQNFLALHRLGHELHGVRIDTAAALAELNQHIDPVEAYAAEWHPIAIDMPPSPNGRLRRLWLSATQPQRYELPRVAVIADALAPVINSAKPDLIWVENLELAAAMITLDSSIHWIYSQHDLAFRVRRIRQGALSLADRWWLLTLQRAEAAVIRQTPQILAGSATDGERSRQLGARSVHVIPMGYDPTPSAGGCASNDVRIIHLGSLETTANRVGLEAYLRRAHPHLTAPPPLWIIGDNRRIKPALAALLEAADAVQTGFTADLSSVLRPFDITIIPYEHDSGYRTKLPLLFSYGQVVVTTRAAIAGTLLPGMADVCVICDTLEAFPAAINALAADSDRRQQIGAAARAYFAEHFTHDALLDHYRRMLAAMEPRA